LAYFAALEFDNRETPNLIGDKICRVLRKAIARLKKGEAI